MSLRVTFGVDPGLTGCVATLIDGEPGPMLDMPTVSVGKRNEVDGERILRFIREVRGSHPGADFAACLEQVGAVRTEGRQQGGVSMFNFGDGFGAVRTAFACAGVSTVRVYPQVWKRHMGLIGTEKDAARQLAIRRFPSAGEMLKRKKDSGRADALLLALWYENTQVTGMRTAA